jgi:lysophospholipase L1-like esterase
VTIQGLHAVEDATAKGELRMAKGQRLLLFRILMIAISATLMVLSSEVIAGVLAPAWLTQRMLFLNPPPGGQAFGSDTGWKVDKKNGSFWRFTPRSEFDVANVEYNNKAHIDEYGGRVTAGADSAENNDLIPFLGDSFTFGIGVADTETFTSLLSPVVVPRRILNLGVPGTALNDQLPIVELRHDELGRPKKYVFFFFMGNDFSDLIEGKSKRENANQAPEEQTIAWRLNKLVYFNPILKHSYLLQFVRRQALAVMNAINPGQQFMDPIFLIMNSENRLYRDAAEAALQEQINRLSELQRKMEFSALIVVIPSVYQTNSRLRNGKSEEYGIPKNFIDVLLPNRILLEQTKGHEITLVDPTACITERNADGSLYYSKDNHLTAKGHKVFADCIREDIAKFLDNSKSTP